jgi:hypothetical protein
MTYTHRAKVHFRAVDNTDGSFWIICEPQGEAPGALAERFIGFDLRKSVTMQEADSIAALVREKCTHVSITTFEAKDGAREVPNDARR